MKRIRPFTTREKSFLVIIALLMAFNLSGWEPGQAAVNALTQYSDKTLYTRAKNLSEEGNIVAATAYLYAYIQRNPSDYARNIGGHQVKIDQVFQSWMSKALDYQADARTADMHIASCDQYPCRESESDVRAIFAAGFPRDMVMVCEHSDYKGRCSYLALGEYTNANKLGVPNDSISSVMVGSNVQVLLCVHHLDLAGDCLQFSKSDRNLNNNRLPGKSYTLNDNTSTVRVTYRPGKGLTLP